MARGFRGGFRGGSRGGGFRSGGGRRGIGSSGGGRRSSGRSGRSSSKGQIKGGKSVQYAIEGSRGETKYIGTTNNPRQRAVEHRQKGKLGKGDRLVVETKPISRKSAERVESAKLASHRQQHGRNPKHNTTNDGRYHSR
ncbi:MAG: GIY-YIG nuclease family protein [Dehalococcoidia bacterium]|nr:GIY-YIG nuclease family protein [Dehalococcoidia bacterium]